MLHQKSLYYHVPVRPVTVFNQDLKPLPVKEQDVLGTMNALDDSSKVKFILFDNEETAKKFALYGVTAKETEHFPIFVFSVKDNSIIDRSKGKAGKLEKVSVNEKGQIVQKGGLFDAWVTEYSNLVKVKATLRYINPDYPEIMLNTKTINHNGKEIPLNSGENNERYFSYFYHKFLKPNIPMLIALSLGVGFWLSGAPLALIALLGLPTLGVLSIVFQLGVTLLAMYGVVKLVEFASTSLQHILLKRKETKNEAPAGSEEIATLSKQVKELQSMLGYKDDNPIMKKLAENDHDVGEQAKTILIQREDLEKKKQTLSELVAANDEKRKEREDQIMKGIKLK